MLSVTQTVFITPPTLENLKGHIAFASSVRPSVRASVQNLLRYSFEISYIWIPHQKIIDTYFF